MPVKVDIDQNSGFCFGVVNAIKNAENELDGQETLYCLGDIVHNSQEVERLKSMGLQTIDHSTFATLRDKKVLLRAHGEPPSTYRLAKENGIKIIDATCPVVLRLQKKINNCYKAASDAQLVIYGKKGHAEVNGLVGQTDGTAIVVENADDLDRLDYSRNITLFSQTTESLDGFRETVELINARLSEGVEFKYYDTICRQVANRLDKIREFAASHDIIYFVAGLKSSNGKALYEECLKGNPNSLFISHPDEVAEPLPESVRNVGVCGATSTPKWLMEEVAARIEQLNNSITEQPDSLANFTALCCSIFEKSTQDYHLTDDVNVTPINPYKPLSIDYYLYKKNSIDAIQWHLEDIIRKPDIDPVEALAIKRRIDRLNQERTDTVELIDSYFMDAYKNVKMLDGATLNTESPAWAVDRLSILELKIYHMREESLRSDASPSHLESCAAKLAVLVEQKKDLCTSLNQLIDDFGQGRKYMKAYRQMKMYNDPSLNPILYANNG